MPSDTDLPPLFRHYNSDNSAEEAIAAVRAARKGTVQTREQEDFVRLFEETVRARGNEREP